MVSQLDGHLLAVGRLHGAGEPYSLGFELVVVAHLGDGDRAGGDGNAVS